MQDFKKLVVWTRSHRLSLTVYRLTQAFPRAEQYGLTSQMRRAAASIPTNVAEGCGRRSRKELAHFLSIAIGSASELQYQALLARDLGLLADPAASEIETEAAGVRAMLVALRRRVEEQGRVESQQ